MAGGRRFTGRRPHHPWRRFGEFPEWRVRFVPASAMPDQRVGWTRFELREVWMVDDLTQAERRCTIDHEVEHIIGGPVDARRRLAIEADIDRRVARRLLPSVRRIGHALAWAHADHEEAAEELWVDEQTLHVRLSTMTPLQRARLDEQMATILI